MGGPQMNELTISMKSKIASIVLRYAPLWTWNSAPFRETTHCPLDGSENPANFFVVFCPGLRNDMV